MLLPSDMWLVAMLLAAVDFSGSWSLDVAKSNFGGVSPPQSLVMLVKQNSTRLAVQSTMVDGRGTSISDYTLDLSGKEIENTIRSNKVVSTSAWRGPMLQVKAKTLLQGAEVKTDDLWQLQDSVLTIYRTVTTPKSGIEQRFVYGKSLTAH